MTEGTEGCLHFQGAVVQTGVSTWLGWQEWYREAHGDSVCEGRLGCNRRE